MIKILIVEDDDNKKREIAAVLTKITGVSDDDIVITSDVMGAKRALQSSGFDLLLLDINLPKRADEHPHPAGGLEILRWLQAKGKAHRPTYIIGSTVFEESLVLARTAFNNLIWQVLAINLADAVWKERLTTSVNVIIDQLVPPYASDGVTFKTDVAVLTALGDPELSAILGLPMKWKRVDVRFDDAQYYAGEFRTSSKRLSLVAVAAPDKGLSAGAIAATKLIHAFRPRFLVMTGICAGVRGRTKLGDLLMADPSYDWGSGKTRSDIQKGVGKKATIGPDYFQPAPYQMRLDATLRDRAKAHLSDKLIAKLQEKFVGKKPKGKTKLRVCPVASGAAVLQSTKAVQDIVASHKDVRGIDMEIYSVMLACHDAGRPRPTGFALKSVCDFGDHQKADGYQKFASYMSAGALRELLKVVAQI